MLHGHRFETEVIIRFSRYFLQIRALELHTSRYHQSGQDLSGRKDFDQRMNNSRIFSFARGDASCVLPFHVYAPTREKLRPEHHGSCVCSPCNPCVAPKTPRSFNRDGKNRNKRRENLHDNLKPIEHLPPAAGWIMQAPKPRA